MNANEHKIIKLSGLDCPDCAMHIENSVKEMPGIKLARVNLLKSELEVDFQKDVSAMEKIEHRIKEIGYGVEKHSADKKTTLLVRSMDCAEESRPIRAALEKLPGIQQISFNLLQQKLTVIHSNPLQEILQELKQIGFSAKVETIDESEKAPPFVKKYNSQILTAMSGIFALLGILSQQLNFPAGLSISLFLVSIVSGGSYFARKGFYEGKSLKLGMNFLMTAAVIGAMVLGEWSEAAMVVFLFRFAQLLETYSLDKARRSIKSLMALTPKFALLKKGNETVEIPVEEVETGNLLLIKPGAMIPLDGEVVSGESRVNEAPITGESTLVKKLAGRQVFAGTINQKGVLEMRVNRKSEDTTLAKIIHLIEEAQANKAPVQNFVDQFARFYTPAVVIFAIIFAVVPPLLFSADFQTWFYRALVLLVISCPCALVISTPVTLVSGLTNAAKQGILIKGGVFLEIFNKIRALALDKTGTLTFGKPAVEKIIPLNSHSPEMLLKIAASIESNSEHPLADAIVNFARKKKINLLPVSGFQSITGKGVMAAVNNQNYFLGNHLLFEENKSCNPKIHPFIEQLEDESRSLVILGSRDEIFGIFLIKDQLRKDVSDAVKSLHQSGIERTIMLTGDSLNIARHVAKQAGVNEVRAKLLPQEKVDVVKELIETHQYVAMVGDGINDGPALAAATVGISMGQAGTDTALETADIALMKDDLSKLAYLKHLSRKTVRIIKQNIFIALFLKGIFFLLALPGIATLWMAVFADMGASLIVIFNGLRALKKADA